MLNVFATTDDYVARYGEPADTKRLEILLKDASGQLLAEYEAVYGEYEEGKCFAFDANACAVCCLLANRVLSAPVDLYGVTQYSQGAGGYTASVSYGAALGDMYLGKTERARLGLNAQARRVLTPKKGGKR